MPIDLKKLALNEQPSTTLATKPRPRRWVSRYVLPAGILVGFFALLFFAAGSQMFSKQSVTVVPVIVKRGEVQQAGTPLFQAAGWIEPRPTTVSVAALAPGVIEELLVVEGQNIEKGEPIARLISIDAELAVEQAQNTLAIREGELQRVEAERKAASIRLKNPVHLESELAEAQSRLARVTTEFEQLPFLVATAEASETFARSNLEGKEAARQAIAGIVLQQAKRDHTAAKTELQELATRGPNLKREVEALQARVNALSGQLHLLVEERQQVSESEAKFVSATALRDEANVNLRQAKLNLKRCNVFAPMTGRILRIIAAPGTRVMGLQHNAGLSSSTVAEMYDPGCLQVRADVRLEDVPLVTPGAPVEIETASSGTTILGRVLQATSSANIQKNTLEVKIELIDPAPTVSPEMLVTATFMAPSRETNNRNVTTVERLFVPEQLIQSGEGGQEIWIVDADGKAIRKVIAVGSRSSDGLIEVMDGLNGTDKLIASSREGLIPGDRVKISGEDQILGVKE